MKPGIAAFVRRGLPAALLLAAVSAALLALGPAFLWRDALSWVLAPQGGNADPSPGTLLQLRLLAGGAALLLAAGALLLRRPPASLRRWEADARSLAASLALELRRLAADRAALAAIAVGVALRLAFLGAPMRHDEAKTFFSFISKSFFEGLSNYYVPNNHVLHTLLAQVAFRLFGDAPPALRLPAFLAGCALLPLTYLAGRRLFERRTALWATALAAAAPPLVDYATDARGYSLVGAFALAAFWVLAGRERRPAAWAAVALLGALGFFAVPVMIVPLAALFLHRLFVAKPGSRLPVFGRTLATGAACVSLAGTLYLPVLLRSGVRALLANPYLDPRPLPEVVTSIPGLLVAQLDYLSGDSRLVLAGVLLLLLALLLPVHRGLNRPRRLFAALLGAALGVMLLQRVLPKERTWLALVPLLLLVLSRAALELRLLATRRRVFRPWLAPVAALVLAAAFFAGDLTSANDECPEAEGFARRIAAAPGVPVLTATPAAGPLRYYLFRLGYRLDGFLWATSPPRPAPAAGPLFVVVRRGTFGPAELGLEDLRGFREIAAGPTSSLWLRDAAASSDVSFAPP